ncbi:MAG: hypothetical protein WC513_00090 [Bacteroidales bacterium]|jgi:short-subunit dehydrogenase|nr:hypothetical protein [Bacteroidales bacterium]MDD4473341.1 hypothetical protein [Bacteroidales bacterium]MDD5045454.1 hypothetical protein [Bacteroidales bacterium]MDY0352479.1 hypothetical protein [Bacteroidales bacterium]HHV02642.1 hypothetical protein [Bacteroidales bacterium]
MYAIPQDSYCLVTGTAHGLGKVFASELSANINQLVARREIADVCNTLQDNKHNTTS